ncbi:MAG: C-type lectin protein [Actinomycetota bacterium]|jgi:hypothetical protein|nr:C-type lectin protein [Actinomycetota bacterium]
MKYAAAMLLALSASTLMAAPAVAANVSTGDSVIDDSIVVNFSAQNGETNTLTVNRTSRGNVRLTDQTAPLDPIAPCVTVNASTVDCPIDGDNPWVVSALLGDGNDSVTIEAADGLIGAGEGSSDYSMLYGEDGDDTLPGTAGLDVLDGGPGGDLITGGRGRDQIRGGTGSDYVIANDSQIDAEIDCGEAVNDILLRDNVDPAGTGCEAIVTSPASFSTTFEQRLPDVTKGIYRGMSAAEIADTVGYLLPTRLDENPVNYSAARKLAGREIEPFEVVGQVPAAGVGANASLSSPLKLKLTYWDPELDAQPAKCSPSTRVRSKFQKSKGLTLTQALIGLEYREGVKGNEGDAQELLRRYGCSYDPQIVYSVSREDGGRVESAQFKTVVKKVKNPKTGKVRKTKSYVVRLKAKFARGGNDYIMLFSDDPDAAGNVLPMSRQSRIAKKVRSSFRLQLREAATGRVVRGARVELKDGDPKAEVIASGKTDAEGQVDLQFVAKGPNDLQLNAFKDARDPGSGEPVSQEAEVTITTTTPDKTWTSLGGRVFTGRKDGYKRTGGAGSAFSAPSGGAGISSTDPMRLLFEFGQVWSAIGLAELQAVSLGLSENQKNELALVYTDMLGVTQESQARQVLVKRKLEPALAVGTSGKVCASRGEPQINSQLAPGFSDGEVVAGGATFALIDCGREMITSSSGLGLVPGGWVSGSAELIANDGASLIANDGASLIANDGASFNKNSGDSLLSEDAFNLIANDGASYLPVSPLMSQHGAGIVSNNSGAIISQHGGGFNPLGSGTSLMSLGSR